MKEEWTIMYYEADGPRLVNLIKREKVEYDWPEDLEEWFFCNYIEKEGWKIYRASIYYDNQVIAFYMR